MLTHVYLFFRLQAASLNHNLRPSTPEAARFWETNVKSVPFHLDLQPPPFVISTADNPNASEGLSFACPRCEKAAVFVSYSSFNFPAQVPSSSLERGLADPKWERICSGCSLGINADVIRGTKMIVSYTLESLECRLEASLVSSHTNF